MTNKWDFKPIYNEDYQYTEEISEARSEFDKIVKKVFTDLFNKGYDPVHIQQVLYDVVDLRYMIIHNKLIFNKLRDKSNDDTS